MKGHKKVLKMQVWSCEYNWHKLRGSRVTFNDAIATDGEYARFVLQHQPGLTGTIVQQCRT